MRLHARCLVLFFAFLIPAAAQTDTPETRPAEGPPVKTWLDLPAGGDIRYAVNINDKTEMTPAPFGFPGPAKGTRRADLRVIVLEPQDGDVVKLGVIQEQAGQNDVANIEQVWLDARTGEMKLRFDALPGELKLPSGIGGFSALLLPYPPLTAAELDARKPIQKTANVAVVGEAAEIAVKISFGKPKESAKAAFTLIVVELDSKKPVDIKLTHIVPMLALSKGRLPSGRQEMESVTAELHSLRHEYLVDASKGRVVSARRQAKVVAEKGALVMNEDSDFREEKRKIWNGEALIALKNAFGELEDAERTSLKDKAAAIEMATALKPKAAKLEMGKTVDHFIEKFKRNETIPPFKLPGR